MTLIVRSNTIAKWFDGKDPFQLIDLADGKVVRCKDGRKTQRYEINGEGFYFKFHDGVGWPEIIKNLLQLRLPILGAKNEWQAINRFHQLGLDTMTASAFGERGVNPARRQSFLVTEELVNVISLEDLVEPWGESPPEPSNKRALIKKVADITRVMHDSGINHRDLYICHFLLDLSSIAGSNGLNQPRLNLIDLHRAQIRDKVPLRWLVKDLGSLYFSVLNLGFSRTDVCCFLSVYFQRPLREIFAEHKALLSMSKRKAKKLYLRDFKTAPRIPL